MVATDIVGMNYDRQRFLDDLDRKYRDRVFNLCFAILQNRDDAEDAVQTTFVSALSQADGIRNPDTWILVVARNRAYDITRQRNRRRSREMPKPVDPEVSDDPFESLEAADPRPEDQVENNERLAQIRAAITTLPVLQRELIELYRQELRLDDIAEITNTPAGTVRSRLNRALCTLRNLMDEAEGDSGATN